MLVATDITYLYPRSSRGILAPGISIEAAPGRITAIVGSSGSGKTTLLACLAGVLMPASGEIVIDRQIVSGSANNHEAVSRALILQNSALFERLAVWENVALAWGLPRRASRARAQEHLRALDMEELCDQRPSELSLGQRQRAAIASAAACAPRVLLADEPTGSLDAANTERVNQLLRQIADQGTITIVASHDERVVKAADDVLMLGLGKERL